MTCIACAVAGMLLLVGESRPAFAAPHAATESGDAVAPVNAGRVIHGEFLVGTRFLPDAWSPYQNQFIVGASFGLASRRNPIGIDGGFLVGLGGELNPHGGADDSIFELFLGVGKGWVPATRGKYFYFGIGPSLVVGGTGATSSTALGGYLRGGCGLVRLSRTRLGFDFRYAYGAKLGSPPRSTNGIQICLTVGAAHLKGIPGG